MTVCLAAASAALAQTARPVADHTLGARPLTRAEGRLIVLATSSADKRVESESDCSHLVHKVYDRAGFPYAYVNSRDLYTGNANFVRVHFPQPGDLIVWRGHVGIIIDPREHSFFSSLRSGVDTEFYDSRYWRARGIARFYRYVTEKPFRLAEIREVARRLTHKGDPLERRDTERSASLAGSGHEPAATAVELADSEASPPLKVPREKILHVRGRIPAPEEVASALAEINQDSASALGDGLLSSPSEPVIVYGEMQVTGVHVKGLRGTAEARVQPLASLPAGEAAPDASWREVSLELQKTRAGWVIRNTAEGLYVPRDAALQVLTARLATLAQNTDVTPEQQREQSEIIRFLNRLVPDDGEASAQRD